ncbi:MAG: 50S ribosomal protein L18Ae [Promethearchaeota archaeon]
MRATLPNDVPSEVKIFRVSLSYKRHGQRIVVKRDFRALKPEHALELALSELGSMGVIRRRITVDDVREISVEETKNYVIQALAGE